LYPRFSPLLLLVLLLLTFSSCNKDTPVPGYTKAWLHDSDGDVITFRNSQTGATETQLAQIEHTSQTFGANNPFGKETLDFIKLTYTGQNDPNAGLRLAFDGDGQIVVEPLYEWSGAKVTIRTNSPKHLEFADGSTSASALLDDNVRLDQRDYAIAVNGRFNFLPSQPNAPRTQNTLREFWYSKDDGLVAYTKTDGQTWYRVW
jgi:hypothetical protein